MKAALQCIYNFEVAGIVFGEVRANLNDQFHCPAQFSRLICRRRKEIRWVYCAGVMALQFVKSLKFIYLILLNNPLGIE